MSRVDHQLLFVYGTLRKGEGNYPLLENARPCGMGVTRDGFALVDIGPFPGMIRKPGYRVVGEVYEVDERVLLNVDRLEGHPGFYRRIRITLADGRVAWCYLYPESESEDAMVIDSGDWCSRDVVENAHER